MSEDDDWLMKHMKWRASGNGYMSAVSHESLYREAVARITALRAAHEALLRRTQSLETALDQERRRLAWIADNTGRDVWLDQFDRRFSKGEGVDGADDLRAAIDALLSGRPKESPH